MKTFHKSCSAFITHGAGPYPILAKNQHMEMYTKLEEISKQFPNPKAIILFSAHWEEK
jgi:aromatic ring-opening dioxygenase catalytic subunit (LigB family)